MDEEKVSATDEAKATRLFGTDRSRPIYELRRADAITAADARDEYVNLTRRRLEGEPGYRFTHPFELKNTRGATLYHMIFAIDNDAGTRIMESVSGMPPGACLRCRRKRATAHPDSSRSTSASEPLTRATATSRPGSRGHDPRVFKHATS